MNFHPFMADADTFFERFDKDPVLKKWGGPEILQRNEWNTLFRDSHVSTPIELISQLNRPCDQDDGKLG